VKRSPITSEASDVIGIAWSRGLSGLARSLTTFPACSIVQMTGALSRPGGDDLLDLVRAAPRIGGARPTASTSR